MELSSVVPSVSSVLVLLSYLGYLAAAGAILPGKLVPGTLLSDGSRRHYRCNGILSLVTLVLLLGLGVNQNLISATVVADKGLELLSLTLCFSILLRELSKEVNKYRRERDSSSLREELIRRYMFRSKDVSLGLYVGGCNSREKSSSLKPHVTGNFIHDWWFGVQLNPQVAGIDLKFLFVRAGMMGWLLINLSILAKSIQDGQLNLSIILYQLFCGLYVVDYFFFEEYMTSTWDIIAERLGLMLVFGDLVWIPFTFSIQGWWLLENQVELSKASVAVNCLVFIIGYTVFRGANRQKHIFKKDPTVPIWGKPAKLVGGKLLVSGYWGIARHCNYLGDLLLALSFSLPCGFRSIIPYFYPLYLLVLLIWRERRDEARCSQKYKEVWVEYCKLVPWRIFPYVY